MICKQFVKCITDNSLCSFDRCKKCRCESSNSRISCSENGKHYIFNNDKKYIVINYLIDGGVFVDENGLNKCDRLFYIVDDNAPTVLFIEFKGKDIGHALEQLYDTACRYKTTFHDNRQLFRIVCSGAPRITNDKRCIDIRKRIYKDFKTTPLIRETSIVETYSKL